MSSFPSLNDVDCSGRVVLIPTAHVSSESAERVQQTIRTVDPDIVAVELDERRVERYQNGGRTSLVQLSDITSEDASLCGAGLGLLHRAGTFAVLDALGKSMEETDMVTALRTADEQDIPYACIDRDYVVTQERLVEECTPIELIPVVVALLGMYLTPRFFGDDAEALEKEIRVSRAQFAEQSAKERLIRRILGHVVAIPTRVIRDERDVYMADKLNELHDGNTIVAVIGGAHWKGVVRELRSRGIDPITVWPSAEEE